MSHYHDPLRYNEGYIYRSGVRWQRSKWEGLVAFIKFHFSAPPTKQPKAPYFCTKCNKRHITGILYEKHLEFKKEA